MTRLERDPSDISNRIDEVLQGIGARGSSFRDSDRVTFVHNGGAPARFLFQELKWRSEWDRQTDGQKRSLEWGLKDLALLPRVTAVTVTVEPADFYTVHNYGTGQRYKFTRSEYRNWFHDWWFPNGQAP